MPDSASVSDEEHIPTIPSDNEAMATDVNEAGERDVVLDNHPGNGPDSTAPHNLLDPNDFDFLSRIVQEILLVRFSTKPHYA